jgi:YggT family protein
MFTFAIIIRIVLSWLAPGTYNPATALVASLTDPILRPLRRYIPPIGGFDVSPIFAIIFLGALSILLEDSRSLFM